MAITALLSSTIVFADDTSPTSRTSGRVCLAAVPAPTAGRRSLSNPSGGNPDVTYSVQINFRKPVELSRTIGQWSDGLALGKQHSVMIRADGQRIESFYFTFNEPHESDLCLWFKSLYQTWQLWPMSRTGNWCECAK